MIPDNQPFATDFIKEMIDFINVLIDKDAAYVANGNVLFRVKSFKIMEFCLKESFKNKIQVLESM